MNLQDFLQTFLDFRCTVVQRRAQHQLTKAEQRDHLVQVGALSWTLGAFKLLKEDPLDLAERVCACNF